MEAREKSRIIVQADWEQGLRENDGNVWIAYRKPGVQGIYSHLRSHGLSSDGLPYVTSEDGFTVEDIKRKSLSVSYQDGEHCFKCKFHSPLISNSTIHNPRKSVSCIDVSPGGLAVSCDTEGKLRLWTINDGEVRRNLTGHFGDVYTCRFFPSGVVVLSGGADMQIKIWSAKTGQCAATMIGHKGGITDTAVVERGRNIVSTSRDGTAKLWDCGTQYCIWTLDVMGGIINGCSLDIPDATLHLGTPEQTPNEKQCQTEGKMLLLACDDGTLQGYGMHSRKKIFGVACSDAVNCCTYVTPSLVACGTQDGHIYVYDVRNTSAPVVHTSTGRSAVLSMLPHLQGFFTSTGDGSCFYTNEELDTECELTGPDCDPVYKVVSDGNFIYTACRDGIIRKYKI